MWEKKGLIFSVQNRNEWMYSHAQLPVADQVEDGVYRVYFASRNKEQRSHIGAVVLDLNNREKILDLSEKPVLSPGPIGFFDEHGVFPSSIVNVGKKKYLYYIGWNQGVRSPLFYASIGLAISEDNGKSFYRYSSAPILSRSEHDPCLVTSPYVFVENKRWNMTYVSGFKWEEVDGKLQSFYHIKSAYSMDGIQWKRDGKVAIDFQSADETNIARSSVLEEQGIYKMWYCYAKGKQGYRIGYATSKEGSSWSRKDHESGLQPSTEGFDNEMMCYPCVIKHREKKVMFYNGNRFGFEGIGLAVEEK